jgi:hypothetical protein
MLKIEDLSGAEIIVDPCMGRVISLVLLNKDGTRVVKRVVMKPLMAAYLGDRLHAAARDAVEPPAGAFTNG